MRSARGSFFHDHIWARTGTKISTTDRTHARTSIYTQSGTHLSRDSNDKRVVLTEGGPFHSSICELSIATALKRPSAAAALRPDGRQTAWLARWFRAPRKSDFVKCLTRLQCAPTIRSTFASGGRVGFTKCDQSAITPPVLAIQRSPCTLILIAAPLATWCALPKGVY